MLEITIDNRHKCDLETIIDPNNGQAIWINRRDLEIESKRNWQIIFDKCKDSSRQKYRKELTPNISFQPNKIIETIYLKKIIKSCKTTNLEFLKIKEKLDLYEVICDEQEFISTSEEFFKEEKIFTQYDVENKQLKEENKQLRKESEQLRNNNRAKDATIKESIKKPMEIKSPKEDKDTTEYYSNWFDKNKFKKMLAIIDGNKFNYKKETGEFRYIDIKDLVNKIRNNTICEIPAKEGLNILNEIKNTQIIKYNRRTSEQKKILNLFNDLLETILTDKTLKLKSQNDITLMSPNEDNENENENENDKNKTMNQNNNNIIKQLNDSLDETIDKSKSFEDQIKLIRKVENLNEYCFINEYGDKEL